MKSSTPMQAAKNSIAERMRRLGILEADLVESFCRSSGPGGQNVNKVSTSVTLKHIPSNRSVTVQDSRSQSMNRQLARERLLDAMEEALRVRILASQSAIAKRRRQNSKRPRGVKERMLEGKKRRSIVKQGRRREHD